MNTFLELVLVYPLEWNVLVPDYFDMLLHIVSGYSYFYIYIYIYMCVCVCVYVLLIIKKPYELLRVLKVISLLVDRVLKL